MIAAHTGQLECLKKMEECKSITDDLLTMKAAVCIQCHPH